MARRFHILLFMLVVAVSAYGYGSFTVDEIKYEYESQYDGVSVEGVENASISGEIVIPETVTNGGKTYPVTMIGYGAFENCTNITSVVLPNSIRAIEYHAFYGCI